MIAARLTRIHVVRPLKAGPAGGPATTERDRPQTDDPVRTVSSYWPRPSVPARCIWTRPPAPRRPRPAQSSSPSWIRTIAATTVIRNARPARSHGTFLCPSAPGVDGRGRRARDARRGTHPVSRSGPGETCGGYSGYSGHAATGNVSSPQQKPLGGYGEDTLIRAGDNGGYARGYHAVASRFRNPSSRGRPTCSRPA